MPRFNAGRGAIVKDCHISKQPHRRIACCHESEWCCVGDALHDFTTSGGSPLPEITYIGREHHIGVHHPANVELKSAALCCCTFKTVVSQRSRSLVTKARQHAPWRRAAAKAVIIFFDYFLYACVSYVSDSIPLFVAFTHRI
jgi:hypothetical protein